MNRVVSLTRQNSPTKYKMANIRDTSQLPDNPVKTLRLAAAPTANEIQKRCARDKTRKGLLQHELSNRLACSTSMVREMERDERLPKGKAILSNFWKLWDATFKEKTDVPN